MGMSLQDRMAKLPAKEREAWLREQPPWVLEEMARGEWWWVARPEQVPPPGDWLVCLALAGRGFGKLLDVSTLIAARQVCYDAEMLHTLSPIPGPLGFVKLGDLRVGDEVFDEYGKPCRITATFDAVPEVAYRVWFSDDTYLDACSDHQWVTWEHRDRKAFLRSEYEADKTRFPENWTTWRPMKRYKSNPPYRDEAGPGPRVRTTQQILDSLTHGKREDLNHCIPVAAPIELPTAGLPIDPWVLGYWLGNGSTADSAITSHGDDAEFVGNELARAKFSYRVTTYDDEGPNRADFRAKHLRAQLRALNVLDNKHVPERYLWASIEQRKALLAGLMDSDGYCGPSHVEFCSTLKHLAESVMHLARSLGQKPSFYEDRARLNGVDYGPRYRVSWRPTINPFRSPRKAAAFNAPDSQALRNQHRMIVKIERIDPMPMRCITVDSPNSMYLAGEAFIPTHNSRAGSEWIVNQVLKHPYDRHGAPTESLVVAETLSDARTICMEGPAGILRVLDRRQVRHRYKMSPRPMVLFPNGSKIYTEGADDPDVGRGYNNANVWLDEVAKWRYPRRAWIEGIMPSLRADLIGDHPRAFVTTTPKPVDLIQEWVRRNDHTVHVIRGSTFDNAANLSGLVIEELRRRYDGTAIGRQELYGELLEAIDGALFSRLDIENNRLDTAPDNMVSIVVGVDPSLTGEDDEMGIIVVGRSRDNQLYVLADRTVMAVGRAAALEAWRVVAEWGADTLICEVNLGKRWMQQVFNDAFYESVKNGLFPEHTSPPLKGIDTKIGKALRAQPVAMRNEQGRLHHVGRFVELEDQMVTFTGYGNQDSPDRLDAMVHACRYLMEGEKKRSSIVSPHQALSTTLASLWADAGSYRENF